MGMGTIIRMILVIDGLAREMSPGFWVFDSSPLDFYFALTFGGQRLEGLLRYCLVETWDGEEERLDISRFVLRTSRLVPRKACSSLSPSWTSTNLREWIGKTAESTTSHHITSDHITHFFRRRVSNCTCIIISYASKTRSLDFILDLTSDFCFIFIFILF